MDTRFSNYYGWESPDVMHTSSMAWYSKLNFINKEVEFLKTLLNQYLSAIGDIGLLKQVKKISEEFDRVKSEILELTTLIQAHRNNLKILYSNLNYAEQQWSYKHEHRKLMIKMHEFDSKYRSSKRAVFQTIKEIFLYQKQKSTSAKNS
ncbi:hypothetical protein [Christiangramia sp.]|uniref:hypothetical protein n=1 Tax=Christiangramia sp. TaxID=1931228 RepID=UPI002622666C|nr:hypothetical protein [Christiangramia sp.]